MYTLLLILIFVVVFCIVKFGMKMILYALQLGLKFILFVTLMYFVYYMFLSDSCC